VEVTFFDVDDETAPGKFPRKKNSSTTSLEKTRSNSNPPLPQSLQQSQPQPPEYRQNALSRSDNIVLVSFSPEQKKLRNSAQNISIPGKTNKRKKKIDEAV